MNNSLKLVTLAQKKKIQSTPYELDLFVLDKSIIFFLY